MPHALAALSHEERVAATEDARRAARYHYAERRIKQIASGEPPLTDQQRADLAAILSPAAEEAIRAAVAAKPPASPEQIDRLRRALPPTGGAGE